MGNDAQISEHYHLESNQMKVSDFTLDQKASDKLANIDDLVECGLSREQATKLVETFDSWRKDVWAEFIQTAFDEVENPNERSFLRSAFLGYLLQWSQERVIPAALLQEIAIKRLSQGGGK